MPDHQPDRHWHQPTIPTQYMSTPLISLFLDIIPYSSLLILSINRLYTTKITSSRHVSRIVFREGLIEMYNYSHILKQKKNKM
jgi:hypothetical protein